MLNKDSIRNKLTTIIIIVSTISTLIGYGSFIYWYMNNQYKSTIEQSNTIAIILSQDIAKLIFLNDVPTAADISSNLKSFKNIEKLVIYRLDKTAVFQYSKENKSFDIEKLVNIHTHIIVGNKLKTFIKASYQDNQLGYVYIEFKIHTISDVIRQNIFMFLFILISTFTISFLLASIYARKFTYPILNLVSYLGKIDTLKNIPTIALNSNNEYGKLYEEVNTMLKRISDSNEQLQIAAVSFNTQNGMIITDKNQFILQVNDSFSRITGYKKEDVIGKKPSLLTSKLQADNFYVNMYEQLNKKDFWQGEILNKNRNGNIINENLSIHIIRDENKQIKYYVASFADITEEKLTQRRLKEQESILIQQSKMAAMGEMLANIAHQWRQPLSVISTISTSLITQKTIKMDIDIDYEIEKLNQINKNTKYLSNTINDFKDFFDPNKAKNEFNIKDVFEKALNLSNSKFEICNFKIIQNIQDVIVIGFENELIQVLMNLINNAKDALNNNKCDNKLIFIDIYKEDKNLKISIYDNAGGIDNNIIYKVFEPYFTTKHKSKGTGIGLYMSNEIITKHMNGQIIASNKRFEYNNNYYTGALFEITIPLEV